MSRWGDEKTLFFIACYKDHECLWNPTSFYYKSKAARGSAYASLLEQFNDDNMTVQLLKTKIKNIRTTYHQELNKIRHSLQSGSALHKPTLSWFEALHSFLGETIQKEITYTKTIPQTSIKFNNFKRQLNSSSHTDFNTSAQTSSDKLGYSLEVQPLTYEASARKQARLRTNKMMTGQNDETDSEKSAAPNRLDNTSTVINTASLCEDEFHFFGMNVAAQLRTLPLHIALQLQSEFQHTLYLARVHVQTSPTGPDMEEATIETMEDSESESIEQDVVEKKFPIDIQDPIELPIESPLSHDTEPNHNVFKKAWDAS